jgi:anti-sigma regulatory factor (Ser/Thr protein kinase)
MNVEIEAPARLAALFSCSERIGHACASANLHPEVIARARIVLEELFLNTIRYGYGGECERPVRLAVHRGRGSSLTLVYEDEAPPFDPVAWRDRPGRLFASDELREGEAGLDLMFGLSSSLDYEPTSEGNRITVSFARR